MAITLGGTDKLISVSLPHVTIAVSLGISDEEAELGLRAHGGPNLWAGLSLPAAPRALVVPTEVGLLNCERGYARGCENLRALPVFPFQAELASSGACKTLP